VGGGGGANADKGTGQKKKPSHRHEELKRDRAGGEKFDESFRGGKGRASAIKRGQGRQKMRRPKMPAKKVQAISTWKKENLMMGGGETNVESRFGEDAGSKKKTCWERDGVG